MSGKLLTTLLATIALTVPVAAQQKPHQGMKHEGEGMAGMMDSPWREMNGFHSLLHLSHQPLMESSDVAPARRNANLLADAAETWAKSTPPAECKAPVNIGETLTALATSARAYATMAAAGSDEDVKVGLLKIHDQFEAAHRACMPNGMGKGMMMEKKTPPPR